MLDTLLEKLKSLWRSEGQRPRTGKAATPRPVTADKRPPSPTPQESRPVIPERRAAERAPTPEVLDRRLRRKLDSKCADLREEFAGYRDSSDIDVFLRAITNTDRALIRQPPLAAQALLTLLGRRNYNVTEVTRLIERDPSLSQALLRHANSVWYATTFGAPVIAITGAVRRIGTRGVHAMVMSQVIHGGLSRPGAGFDEMAGQVWDHMIRTAPIARAVGRLFAVDAESAYTLGLLHDVGKLVLFDRVADLRKRQRREIVLPEDFVRRALEELHEVLGGMAALQWRLDAEAAMVIANHHRIELPDPPSSMTDVVFVAERIDLAEGCGRPLDLDRLWEEAQLSGPKDQIRAFIEETRAAAEAAEAAAAEVEASAGPAEDLREAS